MKNKKNIDLKRRIITLSYKHKLSHIGSCLSSLPIIEEIYQKKKPEDKFVLSSGHAHLAHLVVRANELFEEYNTREVLRVAFIEEKLKQAGIHCDRSVGCDVSTGSLGHGIGIALGMALADRTKTVYCLVSDGECSEGSVWEALRIQKELQVENLIVYVNINGWGAYKDINSMQLSNQLKYMSWAIPRFYREEFPFLTGQDAHYKTLTEEEYQKAMELL